MCAICFTIFEFLPIWKPKYTEKKVSVKLIIKPEKIKIYFPNCKENNQSFLYKSKVLMFILLGLI